MARLDGGGDGGSAIEEGVSLPVVVGISSAVLVSHKVLLKSFCRSQLPNKSVNLCVTCTNIKSKLTDLCGNRLIQNDSKSTTSERSAALPGLDMVLKKNGDGVYASAY